MHQELPMINKISFLTERAALSIDAFFERVILFAWISTLRHHVDSGRSTSQHIPGA